MYHSTLGLRVIKKKRNNFKGMNDFHLEKARTRLCEFVPYRSTAVGEKAGEEEYQEGYRESRRCSRETYPESYITKYTSIRRKHTLKCRLHDAVDTRTLDMSHCTDADIYIYIY